MAKKLKMPKGIIANSPKLIQEEFQSEVTDREVRFPRGLGAEHPFRFKMMQDLYKTFGYVTGAIDKHVDNIVGDFLVKARDENVQALIDSFLQDTNFQVFLREWVKSALITGNGFGELDLENLQIRTLNPEQMYVRRNKKGKILSYNQFFGDLGRFREQKSKLLIPFNKNKITHLKLNAMPGEAYGIGIVWMARKIINSTIKNISDMEKVVSRKAGQPYHAKIGVPGEAVAQADIDSFQERLEFLNNRTEWVTDANVDIKAVEFAAGSDKFMGIIDQEIDFLTFSMQVPIVLMGKGNIPEGLAKVQLETFQRRIKAFQQEIEKVVEEEIFAPFLKANGLDEKVEMIWNLPGETEINNRIDKIKLLLEDRVGVSENLRRMLQIEVARALNIEDFEEFLRKPEVGLDDKKEQEDKEQQDQEIDLGGPNSPEAEAEANIKQPEVPGAKPSARLMLEKKHGKKDKKKVRADLDDLTLKDWADLKELQGFNYSDYLAAIIKLLKKDPFTNLSAKTSEDIALGLLPKNEIDKLREIMKKGFRENQTIRQIEKEVRTNVDIKDRFIVKDGQRKLVLAAVSRPNNIVRSEASRLSNNGLLDHYKENKIKLVRFLAALSDRTCPQCESLNSEVFQINESSGIIPVHENCRCTWVPVVE